MHWLSRLQANVAIYRKWHAGRRVLYNMSVYKCTYRHAFVRTAHGDDILKNVKTLFYQLTSAWLPPKSDQTLDRRKRCLFSTVQPKEFIFCGKTLCITTHAMCINWQAGLVIQFALLTDKPVCKWQHTYILPALRTIINVACFDNRNTYCSEL